VDTDCGDKEAGVGPAGIGVYSSRMSQLPYTPEEAGRIGDTIYQGSLKALLEPAQDGRIVAIDLRSGRFEVADSSREAYESLIALVPDALVYERRVGPHPEVSRIGSASRTRRR